jgi:hypothetical protein
VSRDTSAMSINSAGSTMKTPSMPTSGRRAATWPLALHWAG